MRRFRASRHSAGRRRTTRGSSCNHPIVSASCGQRHRPRERRPGNAVDLLARIRRLADVAGNPKGFEELLSRVRAAHKPKRDLAALLDQKGW